MHKVTRNNVGDYNYKYSYLSYLTLNRSFIGISRAVWINNDKPDKRSKSASLIFAADFRSNQIEMKLSSQITSAERNLFIAVLRIDKKLGQDLSREHFDNGNWNQLKLKDIAL